MDAQFYQSITGLTNYDGFKSLLKNSAFGQRGNVEDENLIFVAVRTISTGLFYNLSANQVAVILNAPFGGFAINNVVAVNQEDIIGADDVDLNPTQFIGEAAKGLCVTGQIYIVAATNFFYSCQFAIFELY